MSLYFVTGTDTGVGKTMAVAALVALHAAAGQRSARKAADPVRLQVDPLTLF